MKLYLDEHCPSCIAAEMLAHYHQLPLQKVHPLNDDLDTRYQQLDAQPLPVLEHPQADLTGGLDVVQLLSNLGSPQQPLRAGLPARRQQLLKQLASVDYNSNCLLFPRYLQAGFASLATESAREHFRQQKEALINQTFAQALANSNLHLQRLQTVLAQLPAPDLPSAFGQRLSEDDLVIFPRLRNFTLLAGLQMPEVWQQYLQEVSALAAIPLFHDRAC
ncbi:hypothetical protein [Parathalassolituus penaei]|uniref:Glutaredoxin 2 C-terminal domain-containing protein n=1 Tax=Parathalassolituus penaei TaxID=2997323 RepID=A0A9X3IQZ4_9GAMM|nr:hypothetical protein [Parathalassolituus penaei]MCY0964311.1 hypothetical protein [Parathalassolituus penaei]